VDAHVYTDAATFDVEMRRVFHHSWVYVAHESEIPNPGDYRTSAVGRTPVIVTRAQDGDIHVLVNTCRHRGAMVCREERGNAQFFRCPYHGWTYRNDGRLALVPDVARYPADWVEQIGGLIAAPRVSSLYGMIFARFSDDGEDLESYLGAMKQYVDLWFSHSPSRSLRVLPPYRALYPGNWKLQVENSTDGHHARFVHESAIRTMEHFGTRNRQAGWAGGTHGFDYGHGILERPRDDIPPEVQPQFDELRALLTETYGQEETDRIFVRRQITLFPNFHLMEFKFRLVQPITVDQSIIYEFPVQLDGVPDHVNEGALRRVMKEISISSGSAVSGFVNADDLEVFARVQTGLTGWPDQRVQFARGLEHEQEAPSGEWIGEGTDELPQRSFYREWRRLMYGQGHGQGPQL
jgi:benzoate/toluate 1,2-dioxygenase alpha subunit